MTPTSQAKELLRDSGAIPEKKGKRWIDESVVPRNFATCNDLKNGRKMKLTNWQKGLDEARRYAATRDIIAGENEGV